MDKTCSICHKTITEPTKGQLDTGYAKNDKDELICYDCCAEQDKQYMRDNGKISLYLTNNSSGLIIVNWPSTLKFEVIESTYSRTNWNLTRTDVWFIFEGYIWHGYQIGNNNQVCHCKKTKRTWNNV